MAGGVLVVFLVVLSLGGGLVLYWLVSAEGVHRPVMDRESAERLARRDTDDEDHGRRP
jgi:hypothetical protein